MLRNQSYVSLPEYLQSYDNRLKVTGFGLDIHKELSVNELSSQDVQKIIKDYYLIKYNEMKGGENQ